MWATVDLSLWVGDHDEISNVPISLPVQVGVGRALAGPISLDFYLANSVAEGEDIVLSISTSGFNPDILDTHFTLDHLDLIHEYEWDQRNQLANAKVYGSATSGSEPDENFCSDFWTTHHQTVVFERDREVEFTYDVLGNRIAKDVVYDEFDGPDAAYYVTENGHTL
ncbi:MAG: hypothetical protein JW829_07280 [Pirellulales bacterium]|nr:hypothetical protein [Pirellulales bacterium]